MDHHDKLALRAKRLRLRWTLFFWRQARKIVVGVMGTTVFLVGVAGLILPVLPGWALIFVGIGLLATEFAWARWVLQVAKVRLAKVMEQVQQSVTKPLDPPPGEAPPQKRPPTAPSETIS